LPYERLAAHLRGTAWRLDNDVFDDNWSWWGTLVVYANGSVASSWQPLAGFFERRGIIEVLASVRDAAVRRGRTGTTG
jgi:hypothetical protein